VSWQPSTSELARLDLAEKRLISSGRKREALALDCLIEAVICRDDFRRNPGDKVAARWMRLNARAYAAQLRLVLRLDPKDAAAELIRGESAPFRLVGGVL
jgi:hypothetical protein